MKNIHYWLIVGIFAFLPADLIASVLKNPVIFFLGVLLSVISFILLAIILIFGDNVFYKKGDYKK